MIKHVPQTIAVAPTETKEHAEPMSWRDMVVMGAELVKTRMMPEHVKDGASAALIMLTGRELGMQPMRALRSLQVVKGKVIESADSQLSRFKADGGHARFLHLDDTKAVLWLKHPNGDEHTETWTAADSQKAGLGGGMHAKFAKAMFRSRAITAGLKGIGWEGGVGAYDPDEARAFVVQDEPTSAPVVQATPARGTDTLAVVKKAAWAELERLRVGEGMTKDEMKAARMAAARRALDDNDRYPETLNEWETVVAILQEEMTPTHVEREPGADDETISTEG
jgi:hypothetical protein